MPEDLFSAQDCENLGILPLSVTDKSIIIGAMNPDMDGIKTFIQNLNEKTNSTISVNQITSEEWEKWFSSEASNPLASQQFNSALIAEHESFLGVDSSANPANLSGLKQAKSL